MNYDKAYNDGLLSGLLAAAKIVTPNYKGCITYYQIEILQLFDKMKKGTKTKGKKIKY